MSKEDNVRVVVRSRPLLEDLEQNEENVVNVLSIRRFWNVKLTN